MHVDFSIFIPLKLWEIIQPSSRIQSFPGTPLHRLVETQFFKHGHLYCWGEIDGHTYSFTNWFPSKNLLFSPLFFQVLAWFFGWFTNHGYLPPIHPPYLSTSLHAFPTSTTSIATWPRNCRFSVGAGKKKPGVFPFNKKNTGRNVARKKNKASAVLKHTCLKNDLTYSCRVENGWLGWVGQFWLSSCHLFFGSSMNYYDESIL